jgi:iron complex transport system permease protein
VDAISGTIGFVGLVVPHVLRLAIGPDHRLLLPASLLCGAALLALADLGARLAGGVPVGVVTALIGAPFFLWLLVRSRASWDAA